MAHRIGRIHTNHHELAAFEAIGPKAAFDARPLTGIDAVLADPKAHPCAVFPMSDDGYANMLPVAAPLPARLP